MYGSTVSDPFHREELASQLKREMLLISLAGPMTNIVLAAFFFILGMSGLADGEVWAQAITFALFINLILAAPSDPWMERRSSTATGGSGL